MAGSASQRGRGDLETGALMITVDGELIQAMPGETLSAALYAAGIRAWRRTRYGEPRGMLCGMGTCYDCLVTVDGVPGQRACQVEVHMGMVISTLLAGEA